MKNILYISLVDWFWIKQRPQHIPELLSNGNKITYLCIRSWKNSTDVGISHSNNNRQEINKPFVRINNNMNIIRKRVIPKQNSFNLIRKLNNLILKNIIINLDKKNNFDIIILTMPLQYEYIPNYFINRKTFIYDCMDNYKCFSGLYKNEIIKNEKNIINISKYVITSSKTLYNNLLSQSSNIKSKLLTINNGVDIQNFNKDALKSENDVNIFKNNDRKKVGYIGTISEWLDLDLIKDAAIKNKDIDFYIIGPTEKIVNTQKYQNIDNIIFTGSQPYYSVPNILDKLDITIMPFKKSDLVQSVNPVKIYEYLAMGKPVIALKYEETEKFGELIYRYDSKEEFGKLLNEALNNNNSELINKRIEFARENSWTDRAELFNKLLD